MSQGNKMSRTTAAKYAAIVREVFPNGTYPCGSYRRGKAEVGDLDIAVISDDFAAGVEQVITKLDATKVRGGAKLAVLTTPEGHQLDLYKTESHHLGAMQLFLTGSARHNIKLRAKAKYRGMMLSQYGLFTREDRTLLAARTEEDIFTQLGVTFTPPEAR